MHTDAVGFEVLLFGGQMTYLGESFFWEDLGLGRNYGFRCPEKFWNKIIPLYN